MTAVSLRAALWSVGEYGQDGALPRLPGGLATSPQSVRALCRATLNPKPASWTQTSEVWVDGDWSEECQGVAFDGKHFYFSSNSSWKPAADPQAIYRYLGGTTAEFFVVLDDAYGAHIGDIDIHQGVIFAAMEQPSGILEVTLGGEVRGVTPLKSQTGAAPPHGDLPWCAVNPWNGLVYSSPFLNATTAFAYDPANAYRNVPSADIHLSEPANRVQGGAFSPVGHLYLATDTRLPSTEDYTGINAYSALNGFCYGTAKVYAEEDLQELEGLCYAKGTWSGKPAQIHVVLLENRAPLDNIYFKHFTAPVPDNV